MGGLGQLPGSLNLAYSFISKISSAVFRDTPYKTNQNADTQVVLGFWNSSVQHLMRIYTDDDMIMKGFVQWLTGMIIVANNPSWNLKIHS